MEKEFRRFYTFIGWWRRQRCSQCTRYEPQKQQTKQSRKTSKIKCTNAAEYLPHGLLSYIEHDSALPHE